jgi:D-glycero-D-manno-heptose 1,7-bisphosphate phosphatase
MNKALFLDRDGVINKNFGHVHLIDNFKFRKGIFDLVKLFHDKNYLIIVVTNQAGIGKGLYSIDQFRALNQWMINVFQKKGLRIAKTYYCPHKPEDNCNCRKPKPGLFIEAIRDYDLDVKLSLLVGDKQTDIDAARLAKISNLFNIANYKTIDRLCSKIIKNRFKQSHS